MTAVSGGSCSSEVFVDPNEPPPTSNGIRVTTIGSGGLFGSEPYTGNPFDDMMKPIQKPKQEIPIPDTNDNTKNIVTNRGATYGDFADMSVITQAIEDVLRSHPNYKGLAAWQKEAMHMMAHKMARVVNGDPDFDDSWADISGYAEITRIRPRSYRTAITDQLLRSAGQGQKD